MTLDEPITENDVRDLLTDVLIQENMLGAEITFERASKIGEGFLSVNQAIEVKNGDKVLKLFFKGAPKDEKLRQTLKSRVVFLKEIHFYDQILPIYDEFLRKRTAASLNLTAKCYATISEDCKEALVFENLKEKGFRLYDNKQLFDEDHVLLVLRSYAKFHAISYALKDQSPDVYQRLSENITEEQTEMLRVFNVHNILIDCAKTLRKHLEGKIDINCLEMLDKVVDEVHYILEKSTAFDNDHKIITHGDCWMNNMLFKYEEGRTEPKEIKLLDFQLTRVCLPVFDLSYFFYCSACTKENLAKLDYYLEYYHNNLLAFIKELGTKSDKIYPYEIFREHWKKFSRFGMLLSIAIAKIVLLEDGKEDALNVAKLVNSGNDQYVTFDIKQSNDDAFVERIKHLLLHFINNEFI